MGNHKQLFLEQTTTWALAEKNYHALSKVLTKEFRIGPTRIRLQFNPGRITSTSANIAKAAIQARPCFLCAPNRPAEQRSLIFSEEKTGNDQFEILVNPFPVFPQHFTIASTLHQDQTIKGHFVSFLQLAKKMNDCVVFYNGPRCGASAPDHLHFQAGSKGLMPVESDYGKWEKESLWRTEDISVYRMQGLLRNGWVMEGNDTYVLAKTFDKLLGILESADPGSREEPMLNLLCWYEENHFICLLFPRKAHRPACYFKEDDSRFLISPASVEMGGLMVAARPEDFDRLEEKDIKTIYREVSIPDEEMDRLTEKFTEILKFKL